MSSGSPPRLEPQREGIVSWLMADEDDDDGERGPWSKKLKTSSSSSKVTQEEDFYDTIRKPLSVDTFGRIHLNKTTSRIYYTADRFVSTIGESLLRSETTAVFVLTPHSLYTAMATRGLNTKEIIWGLTELSKEKLIDDDLKNFIRKWTVNCGIVTLVLKMNRYYAESKSPKVLKILLEEEVIYKAHIKLKYVLQCFKNEYEDDVHFFEINPSQVENVKQCLLNKLNYPMLEEYDFSMNLASSELSIQMKPQARQRPYQSECERRIFINGRARSGLIVLPFQAGKSFVGVSAACKIKKSCLCLVSHTASIDQWALQFSLWSTIESEKISRITSQSKQNFHGLDGVVVTTYDMVATFDGETAYKEILNKEWGLLLLDEVDDVPEQVFRKVISITKSHCKLGLAATLVRKDEKVKDLKFLIGPKLYEANRLDLVSKGFISDVECFEVQCPMTEEFFSEYLKAENSKKKQALYIMNPNKFRACEFLIRAHEREGDKVIVFGDNLFALSAYANKLQKPMICGATSHDQKTSILEDFKSGSVHNTIFVSKVGYNSIDILKANAVIQISSHTCSPRQEAQRLGRILSRAEELRPEKSSYSLVSMETQEAADHIARRRFFVNQGYTYQEFSSSTFIDSNSNLILSYDKEIELLNQVLYAEDDMVEDSG